MTRHRVDEPGSLFASRPHEERGDGPDVWAGAAASPEFTQLRARWLRFVLTATVGFLSWLFLYIALSAWAPDLLATKVHGVSLVLILALGQFVSTFAITLAYFRYANRRLDPLAQHVKDRLEGGRT